MKLTPEQEQAILEAATPDIIKGLKDEIIKQTQWDISRKAGDAVSAEVTKWVTEEIVPEIRALLVERKEGLVALALPLAEKLAEELTISLTTQLKKNLEQSWTRSEILKKLFT